ncbi:hypothetical protein NP233_g7353 [Leucocoprinus birnbaumii]|uniref:Uncharacterized protein n=1 Tax=Leucocoprinus birnbaumii TaxID=56174 RepID=A0AAD5VRL3_9AGAR|nr:hypothetical protein NP233_g7353 [Leucocoprinus birnbaumii]
MGNSRPFQLVAPAAKINDAPTSVFKARAKRLLQPGPSPHYSHPDPQASGSSLFGDTRRHPSRSTASFIHSPARSSSTILCNAHSSNATNNLAAFDVPRIIRPGDGTPATFRISDISLLPSVSFVGEMPRLGRLWDDVAPSWLLMAPSVQIVALRWNASSPEIWVNKTSADDILNQIANLQAKVDGLRVRATSFQGASLEEGLGIHEATILCTQALKSTTATVSSVNRQNSAADGRRVVNALRDLQPSYSTYLSEASAKKHLIEKIPGANLIGIVKKDLNDTYAAFIALADALIENAPTDVVGDAKKLKVEYDEAFKKTLSVYA